MRRLTLLALYTVHVTALAQASPAWWGLSLSQTGAYWELDKTSMSYGPRHGEPSVFVRARAVGANGADMEHYQFVIPRRSCGGGRGDVSVLRGDGTVLYEGLWFAGNNDVPSKAAAMVCRWVGTPL